MASEFTPSFHHKWAKEWFGFVSVKVHAPNVATIGGFCNTCDILIRGAAGAGATGVSASVRGNNFNSQVVI